MGALAGQGQKSAVFQTGKIKFTSDKGGYGIDRKIFSRPGVDNGSEFTGFGLSFAGQEKCGHYPDDFEEGHNSQPDPEFVEERAT
jgi:hypothetical protein